MLFFAQNLFPSAEFSLQVKLKGIDVISYERKFVADFYIEDCKVCDNVNGSWDYSQLNCIFVCTMHQKN